MIKVVGVKFRCAGKLYYFDPTDIEFEKGDGAIVETARGREMGRVAMPNKEVPDDEVVQPIKPVLGKATEEDFEKAKEFRAKEPEAFKRCKEIIAEHELDMKLVEAEYVYDGSRLIFYFTADGRVDFRELVKSLASAFKTRIELRQIGVRDEAMICGGMGVCGRELCCKSYLNDFVPVSIKMAKEQNLSLNPQKISGVCGRLMCCLKNEQDTYEYLNASLPKVGSEAIEKFEGRKGKVIEVSALRQKIKVMFKGEDDATEIKEFNPQELHFDSKIPQDDDDWDEALLALEKSEKADEEMKKEAERLEGGEHKRGNDRRDNRDNRGNRNNHRNHRGNNHRNNKDRDNKSGESRDNKSHSNQNRDNQGGENHNRENRNGDHKRNNRRNYRNKNRNHHRDKSNSESKE